ncbi:MAG: YciI family protein [Acidimicrobiia bacterium]
MSTYAVEGEVPGGPMTPEEMRTFMKRVAALEAEMDASGSFVFGGALHGPDAATVVHSSDGKLVMTDGPFVESKEHIGGFYIINADDLDAALAWAGKVVEGINHPIEVRPFRATGRVEA